jgi:GT2 family glycosyltransferase
MVLDNGSCEAETLEFLLTLEKGKRVRVERIEGPFNYSQLNNRGVELSHGLLIALLNNDVEVLNDDWLSELVSHALRPEVGMVGARLWYPNGPIQHGGVILGAGGIAGHAHVGVRHEPGYFARPHLTQNLSAVTAACAVVKRDVYLKIGGFDEVNLPVTFNDVDFCLRLREAGYWIVWTPHAQLIHHESASRGFDNTTRKQARFLAEVDYMKTKWGDKLRHDPFYNPNLSLGEDLFTLAFPPRTTKPWQKGHG